MNKPVISWNPASVLFLVLLCAVGFTTAHQYGSSWDEHVRAEAGELKFNYYQNLLSGNTTEAREFASRADNYPGFYDLNLAVLRRVLPFRPELTGHLFSLTLGILGIVGAMRLAGLLAGPRAAFLTGLVLAITPSYYGHMFINPKDIPFAFGYVWSIYWMTKWIKESPARVSWRTVILTGIFIGITTATRVGGLVLFCYLGLILMLEYMLRKNASVGIPARVAGCIRTTTLPLVVVGVVAGVILAIYWPSLHSNPFAKTSGTLAAVTQYKWSMPVLFAGAYIPVNELPWHYPLKMLALKIPAGFLLTLAAGAFFYVRSKLAKPTREDFYRELPRLFIAFVILFPVAYVIIRGSTLYNGIRHLLFILPPLAVVCAISLGKLLDMAGKRSSKTRQLAWLGACAYFLLTGYTAFRLHPYQYIYYNELAGGTRIASQSYETDYWGTVYKELAEAFYSHLVASRPSFTRPEVIINMEHVTWLFEPYLPESRSLPFRVVRSQPGEDDYYAASTSWAADQYYYGRPVVAVERAGIRLGVIKDRRGLAPVERQLGYRPAP